MQLSAPHQIVPDSIALRPVAGRIHSALNGLIGLAHFGRGPFAVRVVHTA